MDLGAPFTEQGLPVNTTPCYSIIPGKSHYQLSIRTTYRVVKLLLAERHGISVLLLLRPHYSVQSIPITITL
jgi:hypothetical protein